MIIKSRSQEKASSAKREASPDLKPPSLKRSCAPKAIAVEISVGFLVGFTIHSETKDQCGVRGEFNCQSCLIPAQSCVTLGREPDISKIRLTCLSGLATPKQVRHARSAPDISPKRMTSRSDLKTAVDLNTILCLGLCHLPSEAKRWVKDEEPDRKGEPEAPPCETNLHPQHDTLRALPDVVAFSLILRSSVPHRPKGSAEPKTHTYSCDGSSPLETCCKRQREIIYKNSRRKPRCRRSVVGPVEMKELRLKPRRTSEALPGSQSTTGTDAK
jgi:hypothetical protein